MRHQLAPTDRIDTDAVLLHALGSHGCDASFSALISRHEGAVRRAVIAVIGKRADLVEDAVQQTWLLLADKAAGLDGRSSIEPWLVRSAGLVARNVLRSDRRRGRYEREAGLQDLDVRRRRHGPDSTFADAGEHLPAALASLSPKLREAVELAYVEGLTNREIGERVGAGAEAVKKRVQHGMRKLRGFLRDRGFALAVLLLLGLRRRLPAAAGVMGLMTMAALSLPTGSDGDHVVVTATPTPPIEQVDQLGPFLWTRSEDRGETAELDVSLTDHIGWQLKTFNHARDHIGDRHAFAVNTLVHADQELGYTVQLQEYATAVRGGHLGHLLLGYSEQAEGFGHGRQRDLSHCASVHRVVCLLPLSDRIGDERMGLVRHDRLVTPGIWELPPGASLYPGQDSFARAKLLLPIHRLLPQIEDVSTAKPLVRFDCRSDGSWSLKLECQGTDGLAGGRPGWDWQVDSTSPGALPHELAGPGHWTVTTLCPGGDADNSDTTFSLGLAAYSRADGADVHQPARVGHRGPLSVDAARHLIETELLATPAVVGFLR